MATSGRLIFKDPRAMPGCGWRRSIQLDAGEDVEGRLALFKRPVRIRDSKLIRTTALWQPRGTEAGMAP